MAEKTSVPEMYGSLVFNDKVMKDRLPKDIYRAVHKTIQNGTHLELDVANTVAAAMKEWAVEQGATHFTHWFQPMTGITAEKHDGFISPEPDGVLREGARKGRAGCLQFPVRRTPRDLRGPRLYRMGPVLAGFYQGWLSVYSDGVHFLRRRGAG